VVSERALPSALLDRREEEPLFYGWRMTGVAFGAHLLGGAASTRFRA
jgi:hypothetical protein